MAAVAARLGAFVRCGIVAVIDGLWEMIGETEGKEAWKTNEQKPREFLLADGGGGGSDGGSEEMRLLPARLLHQERPLTGD